MTSSLSTLGASLAAGLAPLAGDLVFRVTTAQGASTDYPCKGWKESGAMSLNGGALILSGKATFNVLVASLPITPTAKGCYIVTGGKSHAVGVVEADDFGAVWRLTTG